MFEKQWSYLQFGTQFCGIEHSSKKGEELITASLLKKSKTQVDIETTIEATSLEDIVKKLPKKQHVVLIINNDKVISKQIESEQNDNLKLVYKAFPNINLDDFYFEVLHQNNTHFVSLCRRDYVLDLIETYKKHGVSIINLSLGSTLVSTLLDFVSTKSISTSNALVVLDNNRIQSIEKLSEIDIVEYDINGLKTSNKKLLSLSAALQSVLQTNNTQTNFESQKQLLLNQYKQVRFFNQFLKFAGIFILGLLLINFLFFNHYFNAVNTLQQTSQVNQTTKKKVIALNKSVSKTQKMVDDMLKSNASKSSFYINEIIQSLPNSILLTEANYQPLEKRIKADKQIELQNDIIIVSGESNSSDSFSQWINNLEAKNWINNTEIIDYSDSSNSSSKFSIKININRGE